MPKVKSLLNFVLVLFILFSIPVTVLVARKANVLNSNASTSSFSLLVTPTTQELVKGGSVSYQLVMDFPESVVAGADMVLVKFDDLPEGIKIQNQPLGATPSNNYQKIHRFYITADIEAKAGEYPVKVVSTNLKNNQETQFKIVVK